MVTAFAGWEHVFLFGKKVWQGSLSHPNHIGHYLWLHPAEQIKIEMLID